MKVFDEYGVEWEVEASGDAASPLVRALSKLHVTRVVLPRLSLVTGVLTEPARMPDNIEARVRLLDGLEVLRG